MFSIHLLNHGQPKTFPLFSGEAKSFLQHRCSNSLLDRSSTLPKVPIPPAAAWAARWGRAVGCLGMGNPLGDAQLPQQMSTPLHRDWACLERKSEGAPTREPQGSLSDWPFPFIDLSLCLSYFICIFLSITYFFSLYLHSYKTLKT